MSELTDHKITVVYFWLAWCSL